MTTTTTLSRKAKQRLTKLADFLETEVKSKRFDLEMWASDGFAEDKCGTVACACGWATVCFKNVRGPKLRLGIGGYIYLDAGNPDLDPCDFSAAAMFFDITDNQSDYLFDPDCYQPHRQGRMDVVSRIRKFVNDDGAFPE